MASLDVHARARPSVPTAATHPEIPVVLEPPPPSGPWLDEACPETEAVRDTDPGDLTGQTSSGRPPNELTRRDRALLLRLDGTSAGQGFSLGQDAVQIGRHPTTGLTLQDRGVSRIHARVYCQHGVHWIEDLGSRNGTYVQGRKVDHCVLEDGDWVQLGPRASFRFTFVDARQEEVLRRLYDSSTRDALTGAYNRAYFDERLRAEVAYALRHGTALSLVIFDIDHFKRVNDTYGHQAGDAVLRHLAGTVQVRLRTEDVFARYGGEEFVVILRGIDLKGAARVGERVRSTVASSAVFFEGSHIPVSVSAGCASLDCQEERSAEALIATADHRLYQAKNAGRNRVVAAPLSMER
jgi:diguanylate cyclase (GGDEF)-like protein